MPDGSGIAGRPGQRFRADRTVDRQDAFVARFLPGPQPVPAARAAADAAPAPAVPSAAQGNARGPQVAADLRSVRPGLAPAGDSLPGAAETGGDGSARPDAGGPGLPLPTPLPAALPPARDLVDLERRLAAEREAGRAEGREELRAQLAAERADLASAMGALASAMARLANPPAEQVAALAEALDGAVARLAAERAGIAIDAAPAGFARRIARLAERIALHPADVTIGLHPADLAALRPVLSGPEMADLTSLAAARLHADPSLQRGDADVRTADIRIADLIATTGDDAA